jgi:nuclear transport factor 2 (NTF2) superfamily protein
MKDTYTFWYESYNTRVLENHEETGLTKRQAVIKYNKLHKNYNPHIKSFGWELERKPLCLNSLLEPTPSP